ncbi:MAG: SGNH/GDSL hydrolase family protein [Pseudomonadota bacterium]
MTFPRLRSLLLCAAVAASAVLASCGGGSIVEPFNPTRIVSFGDAFSDVGQSGNRYTVNDGLVNVWVQQFTTRYGLALTAQSAGGTGYAQGNVRVRAKPDVTGNSTRLSIEEQVSAYLTSGLLKTDLLVINGGISDIIAETVNTGQSQAQRLANVQQAGRDLATQVARLLDAGARYVVLIGVYDLRITPWAVSIGQGGANSELSNLSLRFNEAAQLPLVDRGRSLLYIDSANYFNLLFNQPGSFGINGTQGGPYTPVCTATASGDSGIGISASAHVSSRVCNTGTLVPGIDYNTTLFADPVYPAPRAHRLFGDFAYDRARSIF